MNRDWQWWCLSLSCIGRGPVLHLFASKASMIDYVAWHNREYHDAVGT